MSSAPVAEATLHSLWWRATFHPRAFFADGPPAPKRWGPRLFVVVVAAIAGFTGEILAGFAGGAPTMAASLGALVRAAIIAVPSLYLTAALLHGLLALLRSNRAPFAATLGCVAFASAPGLFGVVPYLGTAVGTVWGMVVLIIALSATHRVGVARPLAAVISLHAVPILVALGLRAGFVEAFKIPSGAMAPTLLAGDHVFVNKFTYGPRIPYSGQRLITRPPARGDVIVLEFPENREQDFIKRTIAVPGDTLEVINGRPVISGWLVPHCQVGPYSHEGREGQLFVEFLGESAYLTLFEGDPDGVSCAQGEACRADLACRGGICGTLQGPFQVARDEVWVMGDSRNNSHDSRSWRGGQGAGVPFENINGRAGIVWVNVGPSGVRSDRIGVDLLGVPVLPADHRAALGPALERCLRARPAETTPPRGLPAR